MAEKRKTYTAECKQEAVRLITDQRYGVAETARSLGVNVNMLRHWNQEYTTNAAAAFPGNSRLPPKQDKLRQLREENKRLRMEREILKKPCVSLSQSPHSQTTPEGGRCDWTVQSASLDTGGGGAVHRRPQTTDSPHGYGVAPNLLARRLIGRS
jgi:transposase